MKLVGLMILSGIPQAVVASRAGKICDFPGNKECQLQPDFDFLQIIVTSLTVALLFAS